MVTITYGKGKEQMCLELSAVLNRLPSSVSSSKPGREFAMLPTGCPHLLFGSIAQNAAIQPKPVMARKMARQCSRGISMPADGNIPFGCWLSAGPFS
jgi:hypothetical protein